MPPGVKTLFKIYEILSHYTGGLGFMTILCTTLSGGLKNQHKNHIRSQIVKQKSKRPWFVRKRVSFIRNIT